MPKTKEIFTAPAMFFTFPSDVKLQNQVIQTYLLCSVLRINSPFTDLQVLLVNDLVFSGKPVYTLFYIYVSALIAFLSSSFL